MTAKVKKFLIVLIDGLGDLSLRQPDGSYKTPLQVANTPAMDLLAKKGINGLMDPVEPGLACGSDTAHLSLFGYDPRLWYRGRGAFESIGSGLTMERGDVAFKSNFATINNEGVVTSRRADRQFEHIGPLLCDYLNKELLNLFEWNEYKDCYEVKFQYATEHRCGVRIRGKGLWDAICGTDPLKDGLMLRQCQPTIPITEAHYQNAVFTSELVNKLSECVKALLSRHSVNLERHKQGKNQANIILFRGAGMKLECPPFTTVHLEFFGQNGCVQEPFGIAPTCMISGFLQMVSVEVVKVEGATGDYKSNLQQKGRIALELLARPEFSFCFLHVKAADDAGHDRLLKERVSQLEKIDRMLSEIHDKLSVNQEDEYYIILTGDHSTPVQEGDHSCEPVPLTLCRVNGEGLTDNVQQFNEIDAAKGCLGRLAGIQLMQVLKLSSGLISE